MLAALLFGLTACQPENTVEGIAVGNPGKVSAQVAASSGLEVISSWMHVEALTLESCHGERRTFAGGLSMDLAGDGWLELPGGEWCSLTVAPDGPLLVVVEGAGGGVAELYLSIAPLELSSSSGFLVDSGTWIVELGELDWISELELGIEGGAEVKIDSDAPQHDALVQRLEQTSSLVEDVDGDGVITAGDETRAGAWGLR